MQHDVAVFVLFRSRSLRKQRRLGTAGVSIVNRQGNGATSNRLFARFAIPVKGKLFRCLFRKGEVDILLVFNKRIVDLYRTRSRGRGKRTQGKKKLFVVKIAEFLVACIKAGGNDIRLFSGGIGYRRGCFSFGGINGFYGEIIQSVAGLRRGCATVLRGVADYLLRGGNRAKAVFGALENNFRRNGVRNGFRFVSAVLEGNGNFKRSGIDIALRMRF